METLKQGLANSGRSNAITYAKNQISKINNAYENTSDANEKNDLQQKHLGWQNVINNIQADAQKDDERYPIVKYY